MADDSAVVVTAGSSDQDPLMTQDEAQQQLEETADAWRSDVDDSEAHESAEEVAQGADRASRQPDYGREGQ
jgi:hypothetical protein